MMQANRKGQGCFLVAQKTPQDLFSEDSLRASRQMADVTQANRQIDRQMDKQTNRQQMHIYTEQDFDCLQCVRGYYKQKKRRSNMYHLILKLYYQDRLLYEHLVNFQMLSVQECKGKDRHNLVRQTQTESDGDVKSFKSFIDFRVWGLYLVALHA